MSYKDIGIQGWTHQNELNFLYNQMLELPNNSIIIEIGCWKGRSSHALASGIKNSKKEQSLYCIDTFKGAITNNIQQKRAIDENVLDEFKRNMNDFQYHLIIGNSTESAKRFDNNSIGFLFLDANHDYEYVIKDTNMWLPKIKMGGIFCGHDYKDGYKGVKKAIDEIFSSIEFYKDSIWLVRKN